MASSPLSPLSKTALGLCKRGWRGHVIALGPSATSTLSSKEMERRLVEMGFVEGARVELLHSGPVGRDPIAVRVGDMTVALRRCDANAILVEKD